VNSGGPKPAHWLGLAAKNGQPAHATGGVARSPHAASVRWRGRHRHPGRRGVRRWSDRVPVTRGRHVGQYLIGGEGVERRATTSGGVGLVQWRSLGGGSSKAVDGDPRGTLQLKEEEKGLGWPPIGEENGLGRGLLTKGGRQCLWTIFDEGWYLRHSGVDEKEKGRTEKCLACAFWGKDGAGREGRRMGAHAASLWPAGEEKKGGGAGPILRSPRVTSQERAAATRARKLDGVI
jgi:hypothetical protein